MTIYIFGSVARGEVATANDVDLSVEYFPDTESDSAKFLSVGPFQAEAHDWALEMTALFGLPFKWAHIYWPDREDETKQAIRTAALSPVAVEGRAMIVATPRIKPSTDARAA